MAFDPVNDPDIEAGKPTKQEIFQKTKDNQDNHESRIADLEALISVQTLVGEIKPYGGGVAPAGWLKCDGSLVSRSTYANLFAVIGENFGAGDGSTTFALPDGRGRSLLGVNNAGLPNGADGARDTRNIGDEGGDEDRTIAEANLPVHAHTINHTHSIGYKAAGINSTVAQYPGNGDPTTPHSTDINTAGPSTTLSGNVGSGAALDVMNPFVTVNYLIKT